MQHGDREAFYEKRFQRLSQEVPGFKPEPTWAIIRLAWLHDAISRRLNAGLATYDLSMAAFNALAILQEQGELPLNELGRLLVRTPANITGLIDGLTRRGLVHRVPHSKDRRIKLAKLSLSGRELISQILPGHHATVCAIFDGLDPGELLSLTTSLGHLLDTLPSLESEEDDL